MAVSLRFLVFESSWFISSYNSNCKVKAIEFPVDIDPANYVNLVKNFALPF
jgi:hypothetical protein